MAQQAIRQQATGGAPAALRHPGMTAAWFDQAVARSFDKGLRVTALRGGR